MTSWASPTDGSNTAATPGLKLGDRYVLKQPIASGGMAQVWSATDIALGREVAAKILHPHLSTDAAFVERFRREAVAAASLSHRAIVAIFDTISQNGLEVIVMELIEGRTLRSLLDEIGAMPAVDVVHFGVEIASALDDAHSAGIVHRDIKPANIMICPDRRVMVTDFGIAKAGSDADLTQTGTLLGTAKYLAPEQVSGAPINPKSDQYALGVVMFEALTGTVPFKANTDAATALARLHQDPPPVRSLRPNVSIELAGIVERLMERDPNRRYVRANALRAALLGISAATGDPTDSLQLSGVDVNRPVPPLPPGAAVPGRPAGARPPSIEVAPAAASTAPSGVGAGPNPTAHLPAGGGDPALRQTGPAPRQRGGQPRTRRGRGRRYKRAAGLGGTPQGPSNNGQRAGGESIPPSARDGGASGGAPPPRRGGRGKQEVEMIGLDDQGTALGTSRVVRSARSRIVPVAIISAIALLLAVALFAFTDVETRMGIGGEANPLDESGNGLPIAGLTSFDPETTDADKEENELLTTFAADGDPMTAWLTESYRQRQLGGLKSGVGLLIDVGERIPLNRIELQSNSEDWSAEIYVGDSFADDRSDWGAPVATIEAGSNRTARDLGRAEGSVVLLWITDTGLSGERFRFELAEVIVR